MIIPTRPVVQRRWLVPLAAASISALLLLTIGDHDDVLLHQVASADRPAEPAGAVTAPGRGGCEVPAPLTEAQLRSLDTTMEPTTLGTQVPARGPLRTMARSLAAGGCDDRHGRYGYVQTRTWVLDSTAGQPAGGGAVLQVESWLAADRSGRTTTVSTRTPAADNPPTDQVWPPGTGPNRAVPLSPDASVLARQLDDVQPAAAGPWARLSALADLGKTVVPDRAVRAAALTALADTDGLSWHSAATDRAGRRGIAVSVTDSAARHLLLIDEHTGGLLAYEQAALSDPGALGIDQPTVLTYTLFTAHTRTSTARQHSPAPGYGPGL